MKTAWNSIAYAVLRVDSCRAFFGALVLFGSVARAEICPVAIEEGAFSALQIQTLMAKGYQVMPVAQLSNDIVSLRKSTSEKNWALTKGRDKVELYFELFTGVGQVPLLHFNYAAVDRLPMCEELKSRVKQLTKIRAEINTPLAKLRGESSLLEAFVQLEKTDAIARGEEYPETYVRDYLENVKTGAREVWAKNETLAWKPRLHQLRRYLLSMGMVHYCRDNARLSQAITESCFNCVAQTLLWLGILEEIKFAIPSGFILYEDHLQPVIVTDGQILDVLYGKAVDKSQIVHDPKELLGAGLYRWQNLVTQWDGVDSKWFGRNSGLTKVDSGSGMTSRSIFDWSRIENHGRFSQENAPMRTELTQLFNDPDEGPKMEVASGDDVEKKGRSCLPYDRSVMVNLRQSLLPEDQKIVDDMMVGKCDGVSAFVRENPMAKYNEGAPKVQKQPAVYIYNLGMYYSEHGEFPLEFQWSYSGWGGQSPLGKVYFNNETFYNQFATLQYWDRVEKLKSFTRTWAVQKMRPGIQKFTELFKSSNPYQEILKNYPLYVRLSADLYNVLGVMRILELNLDPILAENVKDLEIAIYNFGSMLEKNHQTQVAYLNAMPDDDVRKVFRWFYRFPFIALTDFISDLQNKPLARNFAPNAFEHPFEHFFVKVLRDSANWKVTNANAEFSVPSLGVGTLGPFSDLYDGNLPKIKLACGDYGGVIVACPPMSSKVSEADRKKLNPVLFAHLASLNPETFYNPGDLLLLQSLWTPEVETAISDIDQNVRYRASLPERIGPGINWVRRALKEKVKIIRGETKPTAALTAYSDCGGNLISEGCTVSTTQFKPPVKPVLLNAPRWLDQHPAFAPLIAQVPMTIEACQPEYFEQINAYGKARPAISRDGGNVILTNYKVGEREGIRATGRIGKAEFDYVLHPDRGGCLNYFQASKVAVGTTNVLVFVPNPQTSKKKSRR